MHAAGNLIRVVLIAAPGVAQACPVCFGDPNDPQTAALNAAILTLLGITGFMLSAIGGGAAYFVVRARRRAKGSIGTSVVAHGGEVQAQ